jgi:hypothetical protein
MKKLIAIILILALLLPAVSLADYSPMLGMTMEEYIAKYNAVSAPLGSPYKKLDRPYQWTTGDDVHAAWFKPADSSVVILLMSKDPQPIRLTGCGLDAIYLFTEDSKDLIDLISIAGRCAEPLSSNLFGLSLGEMRTGQLLRYYYENGYKNTNGYAYWAIDDTEKIVMAFSMSSGRYSFQICTVEALQ